MLARQLYGNMDAPKEQKSGSLLWRERRVAHVIEKRISWTQTSWKQASLRRQSWQSRQSCQQSFSKLSSSCASKFQSTPRVLPSPFASTAKDSNTSAVDFSTVPTKLPREGDPSPVGSSSWTQPSASSTLAPQLLGGAGTLSPHSRPESRKIVMGMCATMLCKVTQYATHSPPLPLNHELAII